MRFIIVVGITPRLGVGAGRCNTHNTPLYNLFFPPSLDSHTPFCVCMHTVSLYTERETGNNGTRQLSVSNAVFNSLLFCFVKINTHKPALPRFTGRRTFGLLRRAVITSTTTFEKKNPEVVLV